MCLKQPYRERKRESLTEGKRESKRQTENGNCFCVRQSMRQKYRAETKQAERHKCGALESLVTFQYAACAPL